MDRKRGYVGKTKFYRCFVWGDRYYIKWPDGIRHFQKLFWNRESRGIAEFEYNLGFITFYGPTGHVVFHKSESSILLAWPLRPQQHYYWMPVKHRLHDYISFWKCLIPSNSCSFIVILGISWKRYLQLPVYLRIDR